MPSVVLSISADEIERLTNRPVLKTELDDILEELSERVNNTIDDLLGEVVDDILNREGGEYK